MDGTERPDYDRLRSEVERGHYPFAPEDEGVLFARAEALEARLAKVETLLTEFADGRAPAVVTVGLIARAVRVLP